MSTARDLLAAFREHRLSTHTTAVAFRLLVALVPAALLGIALLGALGLEDVWTDSVAPEVEERVTAPVYEAADYSVHKIFRSEGVGLIAFACALLVWELMRAVRATSNALNEIHVVDERRPWWRLSLVSLGLSVTVGVLVIGAALTVIVGGRTEGVALAVARWPVAAVLLGLAVALLVRYAPAEQPEPRWASAGSAAIVTGWIVLSIAFGVWVASVASYRSASGILLAFLILTTYLLSVAAVFLLGVELDELLRKGRPARRR